MRREQVATYLVRGGAGLEAVRQTLREDDTLWEWDEATQSRLLDTPLMLSIVILAYAAEPIIELPVGSLEERRQHIFAMYVRQMFTRRSGRAHYRPGQTVRWLAWLAKQMAHHSQTVFYIEELRPDWLSKRKQQRWVHIGTRAGGGILSGLLGGMIFGVDILGWIILGIEGIHRSFRNALYSWLGLGLGLGLIGGLLTGLFGVLFANAFFRALLEHIDLLFGVIFFLMFSLGLCYGLFLGVRNGGAFCIQHYMLRLMLV